LAAVEWFIVRHKFHQRYKAKRSKVAKNGNSNIPALSDVFQDRSLEDLYLLLEFAHEYEATELASAVATWLLKHKGLEALCSNIPTSSIATAVGLEMAKAINEEQKLQLLQLESYADCNAFFWLDIIQCSGFVLSKCTQEQREQKQRLSMSILQYDGYLRRSDHAQGVLFLDFSGCTWLRDDDLHFVQMLQSLQRLDLSRCEQITESGLAHLSKLSSLQHLDLSNCYIFTDAGLAHLTNLTSLQHLDLMQD
jgi:hypothetical protein